LTGILFYHSRNSDNKLKADWERTRLQTYILVNLQLDKKNKISYDNFKKDIWPFGWEKEVVKEIDLEQIFTYDDWMNLLNKKKN